MQTHTTIHLDPSVRSPRVRKRCALTLVFDGEMGPGGERFGGKGIVGGSAIARAPAEPCACWSRSDLTAS